MRILKAVCSVFLALALTLGCAAVAAAADGDASIRFTVEEDSNGCSLTVTASSANSDIGGLNFVFEYDKTVVRPISGDAVTANGTVGQLLRKENGSTVTCSVPVTSAGQTDRLTASASFELIGEPFRGCVRGLAVTDVWTDEAARRTCVFQGDSVVYCGADAATGYPASWPALLISGADRLAVSNEEKTASYTVLGTGGSGALMTAKFKPDGGSTFSVVPFPGVSFADGVITVAAGAQGGTVSLPHPSPCTAKKLVTITRAQPAPTTIKIYRGADVVTESTLYIPADGSGDRNIVTYDAVVLDQYGEELKNVEVTWSGVYSGVFFNNNTIAIMGTAQPGSFDFNAILRGRAGSVRITLVKSKTPEKASELRYKPVHTHCSTAMSSPDGEDKTGGQLVRSPTPII
jgi:hypothetical protein